MPESLYSLNVCDICRRDPVSVSKDDTLSFALTLMVENRTNALPVLNTADKCLGMISASDIINLVHELDEEMGDPADPAPQWLVSKVKDHDLGRRKVFEHMSTVVASVPNSLGIQAASAKMLQNKVHRMPVLDEDERVVGIISTTDILQALVDHCPSTSKAE
jgi:CBS domain-containing protein